MRRILACALALMVLVPVTVQAQEWTAEQTEVWETLEACWTSTDVESQMACIHEDYFTWGVDNAVPLRKSDSHALTARWLDTEVPEWSHFQPLNIAVLGDMAIVHYVMHWADRNKATGERTSGIINWTEVFKKEGDRWLLLADHGTRVEGN